MVVHPHNPTTGEAEIGVSRVQSQPQPLVRPSQNKNGLGMLLSGKVHLSLIPSTKKQKERKKEKFVCIR